MESDLVKQYNVKELDGWIVVATDDFLKKIPWDDELVVPEEEPEGFFIGAITVSRNRDTRMITIKIPDLIPTFVLDPTRTTAEFRLTKVTEPD